MSGGKRVVGAHEAVTTVCGDTDHPVHTEELDALGQGRVARAFNEAAVDVGDVATVVRDSGGTLEVDFFLLRDRGWAIEAYLSGPHNTQPQFAETADEACAELRRQIDAKRAPAGKRGTRRPDSEALADALTKAARDNGIPGAFAVIDPSESGGKPVLSFYDGKTNPIRPPNSQLDTIWNAVFMANPGWDTRVRSAVVVFDE